VIGTIYIRSWQHCKVNLTPVNNSHVTRQKLSLLWKICKSHFNIGKTEFVKAHHVIVTILICSW